MLRRRELMMTATGGMVLPIRQLAAQDRQIIENEARREGALGFATSASASAFPKFMDAFKAKYPFLDVTSNFYSAPAGRVLARLDAEMNAGNLSFDVLHVANVASYLTMARNGQLLPYHSPELAA